MDRTFEFNVREHVHSLPRLIIEFSKSTVYKCWDLAEIIESHKFQKILLISNVTFHSAAYSLAPYLQDAARIPVDVLLETDALDLVSKDHQETTNAHTLVLDLFPILSNENSVAVMDGFRRCSAYVVSFTDYQTYDALKHSDTVINLITPALNKYLPIRNYTMSVLALSALCAILDNRNQAVYKSSIETIIDEIVNAGFMLTQKLNTIDANILSHAQTIYNEKKITFIGEDIDFAQAYLSNLLLSKYTQKQGQLYKTSDISNTDCVILFSSVHNRTHTTIKNAISNNDLQAKSLCIVTDDASMATSEQYCVIHTPLVNKAYSPLFQAVVPSLLVGYLFP